MTDGFRHIESDRTIVFGPDALAHSADLLGQDYTLLSTPRAARSAPFVVERAAVMVEVPGGPVDVVAAELLPKVTGPHLVALGGGRVIDVAKALAAADPPREVVAIPTSLSGAEMTRVHRHVRGVAFDTPRVRPGVVINDPGLSASQPAEQLAASGANALGHATTALFSDRGSPISRPIAQQAIRLLTAGWAGTEPDRATIALGALLAGWAVDLTGLGPHHALAQSAVRVASFAHAQANAALLPATIRATGSRRPVELAQLEATLVMDLESVAQQLRHQAGANLALLERDQDLLGAAVEAAVQRPELERIAPAPDRAEIRDIYLAACR